MQNVYNCKQSDGQIKPGTVPAIALCLNKVVIKYYLGQIEGLEGQKGTQPGGDNCGQGVLPQVQVHQVSEKDYISYYIITYKHIIRSNF